MSTTTEQKYKVELRGDYIFLETHGELAVEDLDAPADAALALAAEHKVDKLLNDIRGVDQSHINVSVQAKGVEVLWKLRKFRKVAIVFSGKEIAYLFLSTLQAMHLNLDTKFKGFENIDEATKWLSEAA